MNRVQVVVRVRPVLPHEDVEQVAVSCSPEADKVQVMLPDKSNTNKQQLPGTSRSGAKSYSFDACLPGKTTQAELFETCGMHELVEAALDGYAVTIFAFGQTGSGKTHTMIGPRLSRVVDSGNSAHSKPGTQQQQKQQQQQQQQEQQKEGEQQQQQQEQQPQPEQPQQQDQQKRYSEADDGLLPRCLDVAFRSIQERADSAEFAVTASCLELYNEIVTDLLGPDRMRQCQVRQDALGGFKVDGLTEAPCKSAANALRAISRALQYRHTRAHAMNEYSSRSHCLMTFNFASKGRLKEGGDKGVRRYGKLVLVDLAGSERLKETGSSGAVAVRETGSINRSLFTLGQVLASLSARSSGALGAHVPYRDSKLTSLLWEGLRGTGRALMLACLGPMRGHAEESLSTLHFASMATRIKAEPVVLMDPQDQLVLELRNTIRQLREDNRQLAMAMSQLSSGGDADAVLSGLPELLQHAAGHKGPLGPPSLKASPRKDLSENGHGSDSEPSTHVKGQKVSTERGVDGVGDGGESLNLGNGSVSSSAGAAANSSGGVQGRDGSHTPPRRAASQQAQRTQCTQHDWQLSLRASLAASSRLGLSIAESEGPPSLRINGQFSHVRSNGQSHVRSSSTPSSSHAPKPSAHASQEGSQRIENTGKYSPMQAWSTSGGSSSGPFMAQGGAKGPCGSTTLKRPLHQHQRQQQTQQGVAYITGSPPRGSHFLQSSASGFARARNTVPMSGKARSLSATAGSVGAASVKKQAGKGPKQLQGCFPDLDALEQEFQQMLNSPDQDEEDEEGSASLSGQQQQQQQQQGCGDEVALLHEAEQLQPHITLHPPPQQQQQQLNVYKAPEPKALSWAERNPWFGTDLQMTALAYQVHDDLVGKQGMDPASDAYYAALESQVQHAFPDKWAQHSVQSQQQHHQHRQHQRHGASNGRAAGAPRRAHNSHHSRPAFIGAGLKVRLKDPVPPAPGAAKSTPSPAGARLGIFQPVWHYSNSNTSNNSIDIGSNGTNSTSQPCQQQGEGMEMSRVPQLQQLGDRQTHQQPVTRHQHQQQISGQPHTDCKGREGEDSSPAELPEHSALAQAAANWSSSPDRESVGLTDSGSNWTGTPDACSQPVCDGLGARPPQKRSPLNARSFRPSEMTQKTQPSLASGTQSMLNSNLSLEDMQKEYLRQRAAVLEELQRAKAQAEEDRRKLLKRIGRQFGKSRWIQ